MDNQCQALTKRKQRCKKKVKNGQYCCLHNQSKINCPDFKDCDECPVCFESIENMIKFKCHHSVCQPCLSRFVNKLCPLCRCDISSQIPKPKLENEDLIKYLQSAGINPLEIIYNMH